jgi:hypothetical protein
MSLDDFKRVAELRKEYEEKIALLRQVGTGVRKSLIDATSDEITRYFSQSNFITTRQSQKIEAKYQGSTVYIEIPNPEVTFTGATTIFEVRVNNGPTWKLLVLEQNVPSKTEATGKNEIERLEINIRSVGASISRYNSPAKYHYGFYKETSQPRPGKLIISEVEAVSEALEGILAANI